MSIEDFQRDAEYRKREGIVTTPDGHALPRPLDPVVTMDVVQKYISVERSRFRKVVLWISTVFLFSIAAILVLFVSIGVYVLSNSKTAVARVDQIAERSIVHEAKIVDVSDRVKDLEVDNKSVVKAVHEQESEAQVKEKILRSDLQRFSKWVVSMNSKDAPLDTSVDVRIAALERQSAARQRELLVMREKYSDLLSEITTNMNKNLQEDDESSAPAKVSSIKGPISSDESNVIEDTESTALEPGAIEDVFSAPPPDPEAIQIDKLQGEIKVMTFPNGDRYEGEFKRGLFEGWGTYYYFTGDKYEGEFLADEKSGKGSFAYANGDLYVGEFAHNVKEGNGSFFFANGDKYVGEFKNDQITGKGTMFYENGNRYAGSFKKGMKNGNGIFSFKNGDLYKGEFVADMRSGNGAYMFNDGSKYIGAFLNGKRHGSGRYIYADGREFRGDFKDGKENGVGEIISSNGKSHKGLWDMGEFVRYMEE